MTWRLNPLAVALTICGPEQPLENPYFIVGRNDNKSEVDWAGGPWALS